MSFKAIAAAAAVRAPSASAKLVLFVLANYAGEDASCFPSQARVAEDAQLSLRTVRDACRDLKAAGLIETRQRRRADGSRTTDLVRLLFVEAAPKRQASPVDKRRTAPRPAATGAGHEPAREPGEGSDDPPPKAREAEAAFERAWAAYPEAGRLTSSRRQGRAAWAAEVKGGGDPARMAAAAARYAVERRRWGRSGSPLSFHNFYALGRWIDCAGEGAAAVPAPAGFDGPAELVAALKGRLGAAGFASWTAGASWRDEDRTLVARTRLAAATLAERCRAELRSLAVRVEGPP